MSRILPHRNKRLNIEFGPTVTKILDNISEVEGNDVESLVFDTIRELIEKRWDFKNRKLKDYTNVNI